MGERSSTSAPCSVRSERAGVWRASTAEPSSPAQDLVADVVIVGGGGSGLAAAVSAAAHGARTVLLEKGDALGGTTVLSVGSFSAAETRLQQSRGIVDSVEAHLEDMYRFKPESDAPALRRLLAQQSGPTVDWLERLGVVFAGPFLEPPHRVARMHNVMPNSRMYRTALSRAARRLGVTVLLGTRARELLVGAADRVTGVRYRSGDIDRVVVARRGVVLAAGDFSANEELRKRYLGREQAASVPLNPLSTGDGQLLAAALGAELRGMGVVNGPQLRFPAAPRGSLPQLLPTWRWLAQLGATFLVRAPRVLVAPLARGLLVTSMQAERELFAEGAILVNLSGDRFCDEPVGSAALALQPQARGTIVLDGRIAEHFDRPPHHISTAPGIAYAYFRDYRKARPDLVRRAESVESLAVALGLEPARLGRAVASAPRPLRPPFYAIGPLVANLTVTEGGVAVDEHLRALRPDGTAIEGLYCVGGNGSSGLHLKGHGHHIGWAMTSGRLAGEAAATAPLAPSTR